MWNMIKVTNKDTTMFMTSFRVSIVNYEHIQHLFLVFLLLIGAEKTVAGLGKERKDLFFLFNVNILYTKYTKRIYKTKDHPILKKLDNKASFQCNWNGYLFTDPSFGNYLEHKCRKVMLKMLQNLHWSLIRKNSNGSCG